MATRIFRGQIEEDGTICMVDPEDFAKLKQSLRGKPFELTLKRLRPARSGKANAYYWAVVIGTLVAHHDNQYTDQQIHRAMKYRFLYREELVEEIFDAMVPPEEPSTSKLDQQEFALYVEQIRAWAAQSVGCYIPNSDEAE